MRSRSIAVALLPIVVFAAGCADSSSNAPTNSTNNAEAFKPPPPRVESGIPAEQEVEIISVKPAPFTMASNGKPARQAKIVWKNISKQPIFHVSADITGYDAAGNKNEMSAKDYAIYWDDKPVQPGETHKPGPDEGFIFPDVLGVVEKIEIRPVFVDHNPDPK